MLGDGFFPKVAINCAQTSTDLVGRNIYRKIRNGLNWEKVPECDSHSH